MARFALILVALTCLPHLRGWFPTFAASGDLESRGWLILQ